MKTIFFYGLFMDDSLLREKGFNPCNVRKVYLKGYQLIIGNKATLIVNADACVYGTVMELTDGDLEGLYRSPGVEDYEPQSVEVITMEHEHIEVMSYLLPMEKVSGSNREYAVNLAQVAMKLNLPSLYIEEIESWISP